MREQSFSFDYFPNSRIKKHFIESEVLFSEKALCKINCLYLDTAFLDQYINASKVDFKKSKIRGQNNKLYYLSFRLTTIGVSNSSYLVFQKNGDSIILSDLYLPFIEELVESERINCAHCYRI